MVIPRFRTGTEPGLEAVWQFPFPGHGPCRPKCHSKSLWGDAQVKSQEQLENKDSSVKAICRRAPGLVLELIELD